MIGIELQRIGKRRDITGGDQFPVTLVRNDLRGPAAVGGYDRIPAISGLENAGRFPFNKMGWQAIDLSIRKQAWDLGKIDLSQEKDLFPALPGL